MEFVNTTSRKISTSCIEPERNFHYLVSFFPQPRYDLASQQRWSLYQKRDGPFSRALLSDVLRKSARELELEGRVRELSKELEESREEASAYGGMFDELVSEVMKLDCEPSGESAVEEVQADAETEMATLKAKHEQELCEKDAELYKKGKENAALMSQLKIVNARVAGQTEKA